MIKIYTQYYYIFYLNLQFWQVLIFFYKKDFSEYVISFLLRQDIFEMRIWRRKENTSDEKNSKYILL